MAENPFDDGFFGDDFGQKIDLTVRIREILRNYPEGTSILKELIQNADDAGATEVALCLDTRSFPTQSLPSPKLASFQGPALLAFNNAQFTETDFASIQRIGDSLKKASSNGGKTGRFGIGFNSVYHLTELPLFTSSSNIIMFDPQATYLPNVNPANPGKMLHVKTHAHVIERYNDQFAPLRGAFGCTLDPSRGPYEGTLFRFPLRTPQQAETSRLSRQSHSVESVRALLVTFIQESTDMLLFLKSVESLSVFEWHPEASAPTLLHRTFLSNPSRSLRLQRGFALSASAAAPNKQEQTIDYTLEITSEDALNSSGQIQTWSVCNQLGGGRAGAMAASKEYEHMKLVAWAGVAARLSWRALGGVGINNDSEEPIIEGRAFCFLPLPVNTRLPVHINGYFELSSNRRDIWHGDDMAGDGRVRAEWNNSLLADIAAPCYLRLLQQASQVLGPGDVYFALWPLLHQNATGPWALLTHTFYQLAASIPLLHSKVGGARGKWMPPQGCVLLDAGGSGPEVEMEDILEAVFLEELVPVVKCPIPIRRSLLETAAAEMVTSPVFTRRHFRQPGQHSALNRREWLLFLLKYCLSDLCKNSDFKDMAGVPLVPLVNGSYGTFQQSYPLNVNSLGQLKSMGFTEGVSLKALRKHPTDLQAAIDFAFVLSEGNGAEGENTAQGGGQSGLPYLFCSQQEALLLKGAGACLIDEAELESSIAIIFKSPAFQAQINVERIRPSFIPDLVAECLPKDWNGQTVVPWTPGQNNHPEESWFQMLWEYLCRQPRTIALFAEGCPILPTNEQVVCSLSPRAAVVATLALDVGVKSIIQKCGVRSVFDRLFGEDLTPPPDFFNYVMQPTRSGVLAVLDTIRRNHNAGFDGIFGTVDIPERDYLREYLNQSSLKDLTPNELRIAASLPIFPLHTTPPAYVSIFQKQLFLIEELGPGEEALLGASFVRVDKPAELALLKKLGVTSISRATLFGKHVLPRINQLDERLRDDIITTMLVEMPRLCKQDPNFVDLVNKTRCIPSVSGELRTATELYDPEIIEIQPLLTPSDFPSQKLCTTEVLVSLRALGLQTSLTWPGILSIAQKIEESASENPDGASQRGQELLRFLDTNAVRLLTTPKVKRSVLSSVATSLQSALFDTGPSEAKLAEQRRMENLSRLMQMSWVPVQRVLSSPFLPRKADPFPPVLSPAQVRPNEEILFCSYSYAPIMIEVHSEELKSALGWSAALSPAVVALQLSALTSRYASLATSLETVEKDARDEGGSSTESGRQFMASVVPRLYQYLNAISDSDQVIRIKEILTNSEWLWMGHNFVACDQVAFRCPANAAPYLYAVPPDLACFSQLLKNFGIRKEFGPSDFAGVLKTMAMETNVLEVNSRSQPPPKPLSAQQVELAIAMVQLLSDDVRHVSDLEIYAPDAQGFLVLTSRMVYDDAPWMSRDMHGRQGLRFCNPKISSAVGAKVGIGSLRQMLITSNSESLDFGIPTEAYGQQESLTRRLRHILEMYPEGPGILSELIQNADDAGARTVKVLFNAKEYGTKSLLGAKMADWQGPSLYVYNDATFSQRDFENLAKIGQASKLEKLVTTGRFGLGFNAVYHFTDVPSFVTGEHLVIFDPHTTFLPGSSLVQPGIKIKFTGTDLISQFPDQFSPYLFFGCNLRQRFDATLFRFPLRTKALAPHSEISSASYGRESVQELLNAFHQIASHFVLFLRHVQKVEVYTLEEGMHAPQLQYLVEVTNRKPLSGGNWSAVTDFIVGNPSRPLSKEAFYAKLAQTPEAKLPCVTQVVQITFTEFVSQVEKQKVPRVADAGADQPSDNSPLISPDNIQVDFDEVEQIITEEKIKVEDFLVATGLGGSSARNMACEPAHRHMKFIPWGGVAALLSSNGAPASMLRGRAFCFLPLPVEVGLPVHINGYFELSSNRRDIWHGEDMAGEGRMRSQWNFLLLRDVIAPLFATLVIEASKILGPIHNYYDLIPTTEPAKPWTVLYQAFYELIKDKPIIFSEASGGSWFPPTSVIAMTVSEGQIIPVQGTEPNDVRLYRLLKQENLPVANIPAALLKSMQPKGCFGFLADATFLRSYYKRNVAHPSLVNREDAMFILNLIAKDLPNDKYDELHGLQLVPLANGKLGTFRPKESGEFRYIANDVERQLLFRVLDCLIEESSKLDEETRRIIENGALHQINNIRTMDPEHFVVLLERILPPKWLGNSEVTWLPGEHGHPTVQWIGNLWEYIVSCPDIKLFELTWPVIPVLDFRQRSRALLQLSADAPLVALSTDSKGVSISAETKKIISTLGIYILDQEALAQCNEAPQKMKKYAKPCSSFGVLKALHGIVSKPTRNDLLIRFQAMSSGDKDTLRHFFSEPNNLNNGEGLTGELKDLLRSLPIFPTYGAAESHGELSYVALTENNSLPPALTDPRLLDQRFICPSSQQDTYLIETILAVPRLQLSYFYMRYAIPRLMDFPGECRDQLCLKMLTQYAQIHNESPEIRQVLENTSFVPNTNGYLSKPANLYDPDVPELNELLGPSLFPSQEFRRPEILTHLRILGLQTSLSCSAIIDSAKAIHEDVQSGISSELILHRATQLLQFVDQRIAKLLEESFKSQANEDNNSEQSEDERVKNCWFAQELAKYCWLPIHQQPLHPNLPWGNRPTCVVPPRLVRPQADMWLCSSRLAILQGSVQSKTLENIFAWNSDVPATAVASQLVALSESYHKSPTTMFRGIISSHCLKMYQILTKHIDTPDFQQVRSILEGASWIWVGDSFVKIAQLAFKSPPNAKPFLHAVPPDLEEFAELFRTFGVRETFYPEDYLTVMDHLHEEQIDNGNQPLQPSTLDLAIGMVKLLSKLSPEELYPIQGRTIYVPSQSGALMRSRDLVYNDAPWLCASLSGKVRLRFVHEDVGQSAAAAVGCKSLREVLLSDQSSMQSIPCPTLSSVSELVKKIRTLAWIHDVLEMADDVGTQKIHFVWDDRDFRSESLVHPGLAETQGPALIIALEGAVMTTEDLVRYSAPTANHWEIQGQSFPKGFPRFGGACSAMFKMSDCVEVLSGDQFHVFDPSGQYLFDLNQAQHQQSNANDQKNPAPRKQSLARRYALSKEAVFERFPDQFAPFINLPFGVEERLQTSNKYIGTIFRLPMRFTPSTLCSSVCGKNEADKFVRFIKKHAASAFLFSQNLKVLVVQRVLRDESHPTFLFAAQMQDTVARSARQGLLANKEWKKSKLASLFKSFVPLKTTECVQILQRHENSSMLDTWVVQSTLAPGKSRELALQDSYVNLGLVPLVSVAALIHRSRNGAAHNFPRTHGQLFCGHSTGNEMGLPFHIDAPFLVNEADRSVIFGSSNTRPHKSHQSRRNEIDAPDWNYQLFHAAINDMVPSFLVDLRDRLQGPEASSFYRFWPYHSKIQPGFQSVVTRELYEKLAALPLYLSLGSGFLKIDDGLFKRQRLSQRVEAFVRHSFPLFQVPHQVTEDLLNFGAVVRDVTPTQIRKFLRSPANQTVDIKQVPRLGIELLEFCLSDSEISSGIALETLRRLWVEMHGVPLLPLEDGTFGTFSRSSPFILANYEQQALLPQLKSRFVSLEAQKKFSRFFLYPAFVNSMGLTEFSPAVLANALGDILPRAWRNQKCVKWDPLNDRSAPSHFWLYSFWKHVSLHDHDSVEQFRQWPLLPTTSGELISCSSSQIVLRLCDKIYDHNIQNRVLYDESEQQALMESHQAAFEEAEKRMKQEDDQQETSMGDADASELSHSEEESDTEKEKTHTLTVEDPGPIIPIKDLPQWDDESPDELDPSAETKGEDQQPEEEKLPAPSLLPLPPRRGFRPVNMDRKNGTSTLEQAGGAAASQASDGNEISRDNVRLRRLRAALHRLACPVLELAFFAHHELSSLVLDEQSATRAILNSLYELRGSSNPPYTMADGVGTVVDDNLRLRWASFMPDELDQFLHDLCHGLQGVQISLQASEMDKLKHLPLFETMSGKRTALAGAEYFSLTNTPDILALPLSQRAMDRFLAPKGNLQDLHRDLGIASLGHADIITKFLLPDFQRMRGEDQAKLMQHILVNWETLKENAPLLNAIKEVPFMGVKASALYDPRNELLRDIFADDPSVFPPITFASPDWLVLLGDIGLKNTIDKQTFLDCARKIESQITEPLHIEVTSKATRLIGYLIQNWQDFFDDHFYQELSRIICVPVNVPNGHEPTKGTAALRRFKDGAAPKDKNLCFTVLPIIPTPILPPQLMWSSLGIISPPPIDIVIQHLRNLTHGSSFDRWPYAESSTTVFQGLYSFLDEHWAKLSPQVKNELREVPSVPVADRLVKASRLFFRLKEDLSPYMFEVPRAFGAYDKLLEQLGTKSMPTMQDYSDFLQELKRETGNQPLNPNELNAVLRCVNLIASELKAEGDTLSSFGIDLYLPDDMSVLLAQKFCLYNDAPWLRGRVDPRKLRMVHPKISLETCGVIGIMSVSEVVREILEEGFEPETFFAQDQTQQMISQTIVSSEFAAGMVILIQKSALSKVSVIAKESLDADGEISHEILARLIQQRLQGFRVQYVRTVRTRFLRMLSNGTEEDITAEAEGSLYFVDEEERRILVAKSMLPGSVPPQYPVALALAQKLGLSDDVVAPTSAMLASAPNEIHRMLDILRLGVDNVQSQEFTRGMPGQPLTAADLELVELKPLRSFLPNEIVAWDDNGTLKYGVIVLKDGDEVSSSQQSENVIRAMTVRQTPSRLTQMLTSNIYSFMQVKARDNSAGTRGLGGMLSNFGFGRQNSDRTIPRVTPHALPGIMDSLEDTSSTHRPSYITQNKVLDAVQDLLSKVDLTLDKDQAQLMEDNIKLQEELRQVSNDMQRRAEEMSKVQDELVKMKAAFQCQICFQNDVQQILVPCGHLLCTPCKSTVRGLRQLCPFCRQGIQNSCAFYKPAS